MDTYSHVLSGMDDGLARTSRKRFSGSLPPALQYGRSSEPPAADRGLAFFPVFAGNYGVGAVGFEPTL